MPDRQSPWPETYGARPHKGRFWPRRGRNAYRTRANHAGAPRLGIDLRAHPGQTQTASPRVARGRRLGLRWVLLIAFAVQALFATAAIWAVNTALVRHVRIQGTSDELVTRAIAALPLTGCVIIRCDLARDTALVEALPAIANASVTAIFPDTLVVVVTQRTPALAWATDAGTLVLATDGVVLGPLDSDPTYDALNLPTVADAPAAVFAGTLPTAGARLDTDLVNMAAQLRNGLASALGTGWTLTYRMDSGLVAVAPNGMQVLFGDAHAAAAMVSDDASVQTLGSPPSLATLTKAVTLQLDAAHQVLQALASRGETASRIDLRWGDHPSVAPTNG